MNRRGFLTSLITAGVGATVAYSFPSIIVPKNIVVPEFVPMPMRGLPYIVNNSGSYFGIRRLVAGTFVEIAGHRVRIEHDVLLGVGLTKISYVWRDA